MVNSGYIILPLGDYHQLGTQHKCILRSGCAHPFSNLWVQKALTGYSRAVIMTFPWGLFSRPLELSPGIRSATIIGGALTRGTNRIWPARRLRCLLMWSEWAGELLLKSVISLIYCHKPSCNLIIIPTITVTVIIMNNLLIEHSKKYY